jgi:hypothetical protein
MSLKIDGKNWRKDLEDLRTINREMAFANEVNGRLAPFREVNESDLETLDRLLYELLVHRGFAKDK